MKTFTVSSTETLPALASELIQLAGGKKVWLFEGEMGAGKTTLIKELCKQLGVDSGMSSPTFSIVNEYKTAHGKKVFHFDLYRLKNARELVDIGFDDYLYSGHFCFIEWPQQVDYDYPTEVFNISIVVQDGVRVITVK